MIPTPETVEAVLEATLPGGVRHVYVSTACLHGQHGRCGTLQHERGDGGAPHCKYCKSICACPYCGHADRPRAA
jgi:hypothetical protein